MPIGKAGLNWRAKIHKRCNIREGVRAVPGPSWHGGFIPCLGLTVVRRCGIGQKNPPFLRRVHGGSSFSTFAGAGCLPQLFPLFSLSFTCCLSPPPHLVYTKKKAIKTAHPFSDEGLHGMFLRYYSTFTLL